MSTPALHRFEVRPKPGQADPRGEAVRRKARDLGLAPDAVRSAKVYLIEADLTPAQRDRLVSALLADPVTESALPDALAPEPGWALVEIHPLPGVMDPAAQSVREAIHALLGVDAAVSTGSRYDLRGISEAEAARLAKAALGSPVVHQITTTPYRPASLPKGHEHDAPLRRVTIRDLSDDRLQVLSREAHLFLSLDEMRAIRDEYVRRGEDPTEIELETIAQTWSEHCVHKTLKSTIIYRSGEAAGSQSGSANAVPPDGRGSTLPRRHSDPISWRGRPGHAVHPDGSVTITNLLKSTVAAATFELIDDGIDWALSVFKDNSGVVAHDQDFGVCIKVETHNHPSAIEPYGGSATGIGGCIRDVIGTGLGAKPIASTDVFCVAHPDTAALPPGCLPPRRVLTEVVAGIRDYGNRMGIPTVGGAVAFDRRYVGNPLVFAGCVGLIPKDKITGTVRAGDRIVALGGRTGRDGVHGATFSSAEMEHTHADEFAHAVQIGNAIEEKRLLDAILRARDHQQGCLFHAITDCGAGGFSSAVGEMGKDLGAQVHLENAPLKYAGLTPTEIWISEAQERMVLAVPEANIPALRTICAEEGVELADLGHFGTPDHELILLHRGQTLGRLSMHFLHEGIPTPTREATWFPARGLRNAGTATDAPRSPQPGPGSSASSTGTPHAGRSGGMHLQVGFTFTPTGAAKPTDDLDRDDDAATSEEPSDSDASAADEPDIADRAERLGLSIATLLPKLLSHPTIASKHWIIRQYDHEVQGNTILKPLVGPGGLGPSDASILEPRPGSGRGIAIACGLATPVGDPDLGGDPYLMALAAIDECVRNLVCVGADPSRIAILDNFCWPSCQDPRNLGALVRAAEGCYDAAKAYRTPFVSGKDSLNNQLRYVDPATGESRVIEIPPTLLITGLGQVPAIARAVSMDAKAPGNVLVLVGTTTPSLGGSFVQEALLCAGASDLAHLSMPRVDLDAGPRLARAVAQAIRDGLVRSAHDCSDGGMLLAVAEMLIATATTAPAPSQDPNRSALADLLSSDSAGGSGRSALGCELTIDRGAPDLFTLAFAESPSRYVLEIREADLGRLRTILTDHGGGHATVLGRLTNSGRLTWQAADLDTPVSHLLATWRAPLDW